MGDASMAGVITPQSANSLGPSLVGSWSTAGTWPSMNRGMFIPFRLDEIVTVQRMLWGTGATTTLGNYDAGVYDQWGNRLVSTGATAKGAVTQIKDVSVTPTVLTPGLYYMALSADSATTTVMSALAVSDTGKILGCRIVAAAYPLPSTVTLATWVGGEIPLIGVGLR